MGWREAPAGGHAGAAGAGAPAGIWAPATPELRGDQPEFVWSIRAMV